MESGVVAAGAAAIAYYVYLKTKRDVSSEIPSNFETHRTVEQAPSNWTGELYLFAEALRYFYLEYLTQWPTADLFIGLAYLARQGIKDFPAAEVVAHGTRINPKDLNQPRALAFKEEFDIMYRLLMYSQKLRNTDIEIPEGEWQDLQISPQNFIMYNPKASVLRPAYVIVRDHVLNAFVLAIRGTHTTRDIFTSLTGVAKPHHTIADNEVVLGYSHFGMLAGARWIFKHCKNLLVEAHKQDPDFSLIVTGHSMGGGASAMLTMMIRDQLPVFGNTQCYTFACPGCMTLELAQSCSPYVTTLIYGTDVVPTVSPAAGDLLREEVAQSSWAKSFKQDIRSSVIVQSIEGRVRGMYHSASSWTLRQAKTVSNLTTRCVRPTEVPALERPLNSENQSASDEDPLLPPKEITASPSKDRQKQDAAVEQQKENVDQNLANENTGGYLTDMWTRVTNLSWRRRVADADDTQNTVEPSENSQGDVEGVFNTNGIETELLDDGNNVKDEGSSSNGNNANFKRLLYPAGTIYHLVPAYILKAEKSNNPESQNEDSGPSSSNSSLTNDKDWCHLEARNYEDEEDDAFVLFSNMPQEAYRRIRVCRSMVIDHFVPRYKAAVQSTIDAFNMVLEKETIHNI